LRVGRWRVGDDFWEVTPQTLRDLKQNFDTGQQRGLDCPVVWNHSSDVRDRNGCVESLSIEGDSLVCEFSVNDPADAPKVKSSGGVSVQVREPFFDGLGNEYPLMLTHLGIVNHPVIPGQGPFRELSLDSSKGAKPMRYATRVLHLKDGTKKQITRQLAEGDEAAPDETVSDSAPEIVEVTETPSLDETQFSAIEGPVKELLEAAFGVKLPDGTNGQNFIANLTNTLAIAKQMSPSVSEDTPTDALDAMPVDDMTTAEMSLAIKAYRKAGQRQRELAIRQAEIGYTAKLDSLVRSGKVLAKSRDALHATGKKSSWDLSLLEVFEQVEPVLNVSSRTRALASEHAGEGKQLTNTQIREAALKSAGLLRTTKGNS
jgi:hypothetical protein